MRMPGSRRRSGDRFVVTAEIRKPRRLQQPVGDIDAETIDIAIEPEAQDVEELRTNLLVVPVEIGLPGVEQVEVPLTVRFAHSRPRRAAEFRLPVVRWLVASGARSGSEVVARSLGRARTGSKCLLEPAMFVGRVVGNDVE